MPGPRAKQHGAKRNKQRIASQDLNVALGSTSPGNSPSHLDTLNEFSNDVDWDKVADVLCDHLKLPELTTRKGLKKVYHNFTEIHKRIEKVYVAYGKNQFVRGGIIAIYTKMCADSILRNILFHQAQLSSSSAEPLTTVTQHGGVDTRKEVYLHVPVLIKVLLDFPDDMYAAELAISVIAHAVTCSLDESQNPGANYAKVLQLPKLIPLVFGFIGKPSATLPLLHHALALFGSLTHHSAQDCLAFPDMIDFLIACIHSADVHSRFFALGAVIRLQTLEQERVTGDPHALLAAVQRGLPTHLAKLLEDYGPPRCESFLTLQCSVEYQKAMMQCAQDHDLYRLGLSIAKLIPRNEFAISEGVFRATNEHTGTLEIADVGLPFKMWVDSLPVCAKAIREQGRVGEEELADMLDMKFFIIRSRIPEAIKLAKAGIERNPKSPYLYYVMTLGEDEETGLRCAKKGLKCKNATPFVNHALRARATEIAGHLALCRMQESTVGDHHWVQGQAFLNSALDDAQIYLAQAPPDMRHRKNIMIWHAILTLAKKGPELSTDLYEFKQHIDMLKIADEFLAEFGGISPKSQLRSAFEHIFSRYTAAVKKWGAVVARLDTQGMDEYVLSRDKAQDRLSVWLRDVQDEDRDDAHDKLEKSTHLKRSKDNPAVLYQCSWCGNPSAVLRKCGGCENARYCDTSCQKLAWSDHKVECKSRGKPASS